MSRRIRWLKDFLWTLALAGLVAGLFRLALGLGRTTNLSDAVPWGLWKILNMVGGVALSTCGFTIGFLVYVLGRERFRPLLKPAILIAFLGYASACLALLFDIGLPQRFWHPFVMWNPHSFLFEVFWCVMLYLTVTAVELLPTVLTRLRAHGVARILHRIAFGVVVVGISLSCLHHSSLGSLFLVTPLRLHGLWYSPLLPLFFILSAMGCGLMFLVLVRIGHGLLYDRSAVISNVGGRTLCPVPGAGGAPPSAPQPPGRDMLMLQKVATIAAVILASYLVLKIADLLLSGSWRLLVAGTWESWLWSGELLLTAVIPVVLVALPQTRRSVAALGLAAASAAAGVALNRVDVGIFGYWRDAGVPYFPSLIEWTVGIGVMAAAGLAFLAAVEQLPIFQDSIQRPSHRPFRASFDGFSHVWTVALTSGLQRVSLIAVFVLPLAWAVLSPPSASDLVGGHPVQPPQGLDPLRAVLRLDGDRNERGVEFAHAAHQERLGGENSCGNCHHVSLPGDRSTPCSRCHRDMLAPTRIFDHDRHLAAVTAAEKLTGLAPRNHSCLACHPEQQPKLAATANDCLSCHQQNMWLGVEADLEAKLAVAVSYQDAVHANCVSCHERERESSNRPTLHECGTCHPSEPQEARLAALP